MYSIENIAQKLNDWAQTKNGEIDIGVLIQKLIEHSTADVVEVDFQTGKQTNRPSYDGITRVKENSSHPYIPSGKCVWEFSVEKAITRKVNGDYNKRSKNIVKDIASLQEFVFSTPHRWLDAQKWANEKNEDNSKKWKNVRAYDAVKLAKWINYEVFGKHILNEIIPFSYDGRIKNYKTLYEEYSCGILPEDIVFEENIGRIEKIINWCFSKDVKHITVKCLVPNRMESFHSISVYLEKCEISCLEKNRLVFIDADDIPIGQLLNLEKENILIVFNKCSQELLNYQKKKGFRILILTDGVYSFPVIKGEDEGEGMRPISERNISKMLACFGFPPDKIQEILAISGTDYENIRKNILRR